MAARLPVAARGSAALAPGHDYRNLTVLATNYFVSRGVLPGYGAFQMEAMKIGRDSGIAGATVVRAMVFAVVLGLAFGFWLHLDAAYEYGANVLEGGTSEGGYRVELTRRQYDAVAGYMTAPAKPGSAGIVAAFAGAAQAGILVVLRRVFLRFPLHPLGFALAGGIVNHHRRTLPRELSCDLRTYATGGAGDDGCLAFQLHLAPTSPSPKSRAALSPTNRSYSAGLRKSHPFK